MIISASIPFPPITWWLQALSNHSILIDISEHYQKMSYRNRYYVASPQGKLMLSIPLIDGRNQRKQVSQVMIDYRTDWQKSHWRTIESCYRRSPFFIYFEHLLKPLYEQQFDYLWKWNKASLEVIFKILGLQIPLSFAEHYQPIYANDDVDIRSSFTPQTVEKLPTLTYHQVFIDAIGFLPNCSILDALFCEGKDALKIISPII